jgi:Ca-activated chloride channel family protein
MQVFSRSLPASAVAMIAAGVLVSGHSPQQQPTFRTGVDVVRVDVSVSHGGEHISGLRAGNFEVFDNGARQKISNVSLEQMPLETYLVFDVSGSIAGAGLEQLRSAAEAFVDGLAPQDKVALITFSDHAELRQPLTGDLEAFRRSLSDIKAGGQTALYDAALHAINLRHPAIDSRGVLLVLTDQGDNASNATPKQVIETAEKSDIIAYGVLSNEQGGGGMRGMGGTGGIAFRPPNVQFQIGFLRSLAETTGGRVFRTDARLPLDDVFTMVLEDARARYVLTYSPDKPAPGWHNLKVKLVDAKGDVVARRGYFVSTSAAPQK